MVSTCLWQRPISTQIRRCGDMRRFTTLVCLLSLISGLAQDVHLSQFYSADLNLNPAMGGHYNGEFRIAGNYRNQWRQINDPITTAIIAFDKKFDYRYDKIDAGIIVLQDQFAGFNLNTQKVMLSAAYHKRAGSSTLRAGVQAGMTFKSTDLQNQTFPNQWIYETGTFDQAVSNQEANLNVSQQFLDVNAGLAWTGNALPYKPTIGLALFHVNRPDDTYHLEAVEKLTMRKVVHGEAHFAMNNDITITPRLMYMWTTKVENMVLGGIASKTLQDPTVTKVFGGVLYRGGFGRNADSVIPVLGMGFENIDVGLSYDLTVSSLNGSNPKNSLELSLVYTAPLIQPKKLTIPCDRF